MTETKLPDVGPWAKDKLERLRKYLAAYTTILAAEAAKEDSWLKGFVFIDAFAAAGKARVRKSKSEEAEPTALFDREAEVRADKGLQELIDGSPVAALSLEKPFSRYVFVELDDERVEVLKKLKGEFPNRQIKVIQEDCNSYLQRMVNDENVEWKEWRAVVFLDPFGMQVPWATVQALARTKAIEVFINFPVGMAIQRLLKTSADFSTKERAKLDAYFGDSSWFDLLYEKRATLFEEETVKVENAGKRLVSWYRQRLAKAFGHVSEPYLVTNTKGGHLYFLIHAGPNATGARIATDVLRGGTKLTTTKSKTTKKRKR